MRPVLELSDQQVAVMRSAVDLWARIGCGELVALLGHPEISRRLTTDQGVTTEDVRRLLESLKTAIFGLAANTYYGIQARDIGESSRIAYDLKQVIADDAADPPVHTSAEPLPVFRKVPKAPISFCDRWFHWCQQMQLRFVEAGYTAWMLRPSVPSSNATLKLESDSLQATVVCDERSAKFTIVDKAGQSLMNHQTVGAAFNISFRQFFQALDVDVSDVMNWQI